MEKYNIFYCPHCFGYLSIADQIIFKVKSKHGDIGLLMLSTDISNFDSTIVSGSLKKEENELYEFYCPLCSKLLNLESSGMRLVKVYMKDKNKDKYEVYFSGVYGEYATYAVRDYTLKYFGPHSKRYLEQIEKYKEYYEKYL